MSLTLDISDQVDVRDWSRNFPRVEERILNEPQLFTLPLQDLSSVTYRQDFRGLIILILEWNPDRVHSSKLSTVSSRFSIVNYDSQLCSEFLLVKDKFCRPWGV
ncbi:hypothetical protein J6590_004237 [Homalodisca vitripennis]|nr:hypothetical protein J6590_004237 [Homalodisca vitripennis]